MENEVKEQVTRKDWDRLQTVGRFLLMTDLGITETATTVEENNAADITATTTANTELLIEVKTLSGNTPYSYLGDNFKMVKGELGEHCNIINKRTKKGNYWGCKYWKFETGKLDIMIFYHPKTLQLWWLTREQVLGEANVGEALMWQTHTKEFDDKDRGLELKAVLDLDMAILYRSKHLKMPE